MITDRLYGMAGGEAKYLTPLAAFEAEAWELDPTAGETSWPVDEWTVRSAGNVLPTADQVINAILDNLFLAMRIEEPVYELLEDAATDQVRSYFQLALDRWAAEATTQIADQQVAVHIVTLVDGNPSFATPTIPRRKARP